MVLHITWKTIQKSNQQNGFIFIWILGLIFHKLEFSYQNSVIHLTKIFPGFLSLDLYKALKVAWNGCYCCGLTWKNLKVMLCVSCLPLLLPPRAQLCKHFFFLFFFSDASSLLLIGRRAARKYFETRMCCSFFCSMIDRRTIRQYRVS